MKRILSVLLSLTVILSTLTVGSFQVYATTPDTPVLTSMSTVPCGFIVRWDKTNDADGYEIQYATWSNFGNGAIADVASSTATNQRIDGRASETLYYVRLRSYIKSGNNKTYSSWSNVKSVTTRHYNEADPASISSVTANGNGFDVKISKVDNADGYQVRYATWSDYGNSKTDTFKGNTDTTLTVTGRAYDTNYYVQARTYRNVNGNTYYSAWTASKQVVTAKDPKYPSETSISNVKANSNGFDVTVSKATNADGYQVRYATWSNFGNSKTDTFKGNTDTTLTVTGRAYDTKYYVQARTYKTTNGVVYYSSWTNAQQVTTAKDPNYPNDTAISSVKTNENGFDVTVSKVDNATGYEIRYATQKDFGNAKTDKFDNSKTTFTITGRAYDAIYYVQARAYNTVNGKVYYSNWSASKQVSTASKYPGASSITKVTANKNGFDVTVSKASNVTGYQIRYATWSDFSNAKTDTFNGNSKTTFTITGRAYDTKYYVQARTYKIAYGEYYYSNWTSSQQVTTAKDPYTPKATSITSVTGDINAFTVKWNAVSGVSGYEIQFATKSDFSNGATQTADGSATSKTITGRAGNCKYYVRIRAYNTVSGSKHYSDWSAVKNVTTLNTYANDLKDKGFPDSYIPALVELHEKYPNWIFEPFKTGLNWSSAVSGERSHGNTVPHSQQLIQYWSGNHNKGYYCTCSLCYVNGKYKTYEGGGWVAASQKAVEYYMDPRNFLNEQEIFQFESTKYNGVQTQSGVETILKGTWMYDSKITYLDANGKTQTINKKYSEAIMEASDKSGLSAYYLASKIRQEVGGATATAGGASGTVSGYKGIYNYYNIYAYTGANDGLKWASATATGAGYYTNCICKIRSTPSTATDSNILYSSVPENTKVTILSTTEKQSDGYKWYQVSLTANGKNYKGYIRSDLIDYLNGTTPSYGRPWTDPYKSIINGAQWIANNYGEQFTGYLQKFNVNSASGQLYQHEYMANVQAAASEAKSTYTAYKNAGILGNTKTFSIPVFNNMP